MPNDTEWDEVIASWLAGPNDDLTELLALLLMDMDLSEESDPDEPDLMTKGEMRIENLVHDLDATPLNLKRVRRWMKGRILLAGPERLLSDDFRALMKDAEQREVEDFARTNFCRGLVAPWLRLSDDIINSEKVRGP